MSFPVSVVDMLAASLLRNILKRPSKLPFLRSHFYVDECFVCMYVYHVCTRCPWRRPKESFCSPGTGVTDRRELPCGCWEPSPSALRATSVLSSVPPQSGTSVPCCQRPSLAFAFSSPWEAEMLRACPQPAFWSPSASAQLPWNGSRDDGEPPWSQLCSQKMAALLCFNLLWKHWDPSPPSLHCTDRLQWKLGSHDWGPSSQQGGKAASGCLQSEPVALTERLRLSDDIELGRGRGFSIKT